MINSHVTIHPCFKLEDKKFILLVELIKDSQLVRTSRSRSQ